MSEKGLKQMAEENPPPPPFPAQVWETLSKIDVSDFIETKGSGNYQLSYLSWTFAWAQLMNCYPESQFFFADDERHPDNTLTVRCTVVVRKDDFAWSRDMWLPVMDHKNQAVENPDARQISDSRMRCLVKCLAMLGLGLDVYAGSDIPMGSLDESINDDQLEAITDLLEKSGADVTRFLAWLDVDGLSEIPKKKFRQARYFLERKIKEKGK